MVPSMPHTPLAQIHRAQTQKAPQQRVAGHFGELMQGRLGPDGPVALVSLPCPSFWVDTDPDTDFDATLTSARLVDLCAALDVPVPDRPIVLGATMPPGGGAGSSTAGLVATARALGFSGTPDALAQICAQIEGASDPLMFPQPERLLFAPREGRILRPLPALPRFAVLGGFVGPPRRTDPADTRFADFADLIVDWCEGMAVARMAALATQSAQRSLALRGPALDPTAALARDLGALGWIIAHTGSARGLIFAPGAVPALGVRALTEAGFTQVVRFDAGGTA